jgi:PAS domain S-box-containing protein
MIHAAVDQASRSAPVRWLSLSPRPYVLWPREKPKGEESAFAAAEILPRTKHYKAPAISGFHNAGLDVNVLFTINFGDAICAQERFAMPDRHKKRARPQILSDFGEFARRSENLNGALFEACRVVGEALGTGRASVLEKQEGGNELLLRASFGWPHDSSGTLRVPVDDPSYETFFGKSDGPVLACNVDSDDRFDTSAYLQAANLKAFASAPIFAAGARHYGSIQVDSDDPREFDPDDIQFLRVIALFIGMMVDRLDLTAKQLGIERKRSADLNAMEELQSVSSELVGEHEPRALYQRIVEAASALMQSDAASIQAPATSSCKLGLLASQGLHEKTAEAWRSVQTNTDSPPERALRTGERVTVPDIDKLEGDRMYVEATHLSNILSLQATPLISFNGQIVGVLSTYWRERHHLSADSYRFFDVLARLAADLLDRMHINEKVRESEQRLQQFGEASQDVLWLRDARTLQWLYLTPAFEAIYGINREDALTGDNYSSWLQLIVPEDRPIAQEAVQRVLRGDRTTFDYRIQRPVDGAIRWLRDTDFPITNVSGEITVFGGVGHDLTELRETELRLRTLVEGIPQLVWRAVGKGEWTWASPQWTEYTGQEESDSHGSNWLRSLHPDDVGIARQAWSTAIHSGGFEVEYRIRHAASQSYRWFKTRATPVRDDNGVVVEWLGTSTDIDALHTLQARQRVLVTELQHRTFNLISIIRDMVDEAVRSSDSLHDFEIKLQDRLGALARVQRLLSRLNEGDHVFFDELIRNELAAVGALDNGEQRVSLQGPDGVALRPAALQAFAMVLHELTTNAVKYGALKQSASKLKIAWAIDQAIDDTGPWLRVDWQETDVIMPNPGGEPLGTGQGRILIEEALPYQFNARTTFALTPDGVRCSIALPMSALA